MLKELSVKFCKSFSCNNINFNIFVIFSLNYLRDDLRTYEKYKLFFLIKCVNIIIWIVKTQQTTIG